MLEGLLKLFIESENGSSVVAKRILNNNMSSKRPFRRLNKYKDKDGIYVVIKLRYPVKVYQKDWIYKI